MSYTPKVSTITPCFKMKSYLKKFLEELPKQTYFENLEIVLDHNEPDEEEINWVKEFSKKYPNKIKHIIINKVDPIGVSMNRCIKEATGEFLTIWNVDDLRTENSIELQVNTILKNNVDIAIGDYIIVRKFGNKKGKLINIKKYTEKDYLRSMIFGPFFMFKKSLCQKAGYFDEQLKSGADFDFAIRLAFQGKVGKIQNILGYYLNEGKGASTRPDSKQAIERTVIELRYGIFEKIDLSFIPYIIEYSIPNIYFFGETFLVKDFIPNYEKIIRDNSKLIYKSILKTFLYSYTKINKIKYFIKKIIKKYFLKIN